ncbi:chemotaxis protein CheW [Geobacter sp. OR-1]|uniref:chemotaxis protein CheW n=1 Tax=Geobacter sp. OR-1 TaxID=1266765 RepID=UPI0005421517|nr:chemotaxis protein CheW [Geobacter sp. OR-1]GAM10255.1 chemotaxis protein CheW [Geobacter sp. OR-1]
MTGSEQIVVFTLDDQRYGIPLEMVERVVRMVEITPLPGVAGFIRGVINVQGKILPVLDQRRRFGLSERPVELSDQLIIVKGAKRRLALMTDMACEVRECPEQIQTEAAEIISDLPFLAGVAKLSDGLILLQDPEALLSPAETEVIDELMEQEQP